jgi:uncharacterized membrane protein (UPF0182 family)
MEETLDKALDRLFPSDDRVPTVVPTTGDSGTTAADSDPAAAQTDPLMVRALEHYRRAMKAQRDGNWGLYGDEIRLLGEALERRNENR